MSSRSQETESGRANGKVVVDQEEASAISRSPDVQNGEDLKEVELLVLEVSGELDYSETSSTEQVVYPRKTLISSAPSPCTHKHL